MNDGRNSNHIMAFPEKNYFKFGVDVKVKSFYYYDDAEFQKVFFWECHDVI